MIDGEEFEFEIPATHGDLVTVDGYEERLFMVIAYQLIRNCTPEEEYNEVVYEVLDAYSGEFLEVDGEDVEFVTDAGQADEYIRANPQPKQFAIDVSHLLKEAEPVAKEERKPTARELSGKEAEERKKARKEKAEKVDNLLDIAIWNRKMLSKTNDESYGERLFAVEAELKELTEGDN
jgi:hypothetical protein